MLAGMVRGSIHVNKRPVRATQDRGTNLSAEPAFFRLATRVELREKNEARCGVRYPLILAPGRRIKFPLSATSILRTQRIIDTHHLICLLTTTSRPKDGTLHYARRVSASLYR